MRSPVKIRYEKEMILFENNIEKVNNFNNKNGLLYYNLNGAGSHELFSYFNGTNYEASIGIASNGESIEEIKVAANDENIITDENSLNGFIYEFHENDHTIVDVSTRTTRHLHLDSDHNKNNHNDAVAISEVIKLATANAFKSYQAFAFSVSWNSIKELGLAKLRSYFDQINLMLNRDASCYENVCIIIDDFDARFTNEAVLTIFARINSLLQADDSTKQLIDTIIENENYILVDKFSDQSRNDFWQKISLLEDKKKSINLMFSHIYRRSFDQFDRWINKIVEDYRALINGTHPSMRPVRSDDIITAYNCLDRLIHDRQEFRSIKHNMSRLINRELDLRRDHLNRNRKPSPYFSDLQRNFFNTFFQLAYYVCYKVYQPDEPLLLNLARQLTDDYVNNVKEGKQFALTNNISPLLNYEILHYDHHFGTQSFFYERTAQPLVTASLAEEGASCGF